MYKLPVNNLQTIGFILVETFGKLLEGWRKNAGISQSELARRLNLSPTYISQLERDYYPNSKSGKGRPSEEIVARIARVLSVPIDKARIAAGYAPKRLQPDESFLQSRLGIINNKLEGLSKQNQAKAEILIESLESLIEKLSTQEARGIDDKKSAVEIKAIPVKNFLEDEKQGKGKQRA